MNETGVCQQPTLGATGAGETDVLEGEMGWKSGHGAEMSTASGGTAFRAEASVSGLLRPHLPYAKDPLNRLTIFPQDRNGKSLSREGLWRVIQIFETVL